MAENSDQALGTRAGWGVASGAEQPPAEWGGTWEAYYELRRNFPEKRARVAWEVLEPYRGMMIAWSPDAARIIDAAPEQDELYRRLVERGIDPLLVVLERVPTLNEKAWA